MKKKKQSKIAESVDESRPPDFSTAITRIAVAQICQSVGFRAAQRSALETLTDVAARYLRSLAKAAAESAVSTGRTQSNFFDVVCSLEELHSPFGFRGNSNVGQPLYRSSTVEDIMRFVNYSREIPFAKPVPRRKNAAVTALPLSNGSRYRGNHIPKWLPAIPDMKREEEGNGEEKWGVILESGTGEKIGKKRSGLELELAGGREGKKRELELELELPKERGRVSFKLGKGGNKGGGIERVELVKNGVCRGGKRIMCQM